VATKSSRPATSSNDRLLEIGDRITIARRRGIVLVYRYELRRNEEIVATGHLTRETPLQVGDRLMISRSHGIVRSIDPTIGEQELQLIIQLLPNALDR
jgi:hypothetical protein